MSFRSNIVATDYLFAGEDKQLSYEVFAGDSKTSMTDSSPFVLRWELRYAIEGQDPQHAQGETVLVKTSTDGSITVTGIYSAIRSTNTQRIVVAIADTDTEALPPGHYVCALKRMDTGSENVLSHGTVDLLLAAAR